MDDPEFPLPELRDWAAETLGMSPLLLTTAARAVFLRRLPERDFVPPADWRCAFEIRSHTFDPFLPLSGDDLPMLALERNLELVVQEFAGRFFSLSPEERREQLLQLYARCGAFPKLEERLLRLRILEDVDSNVGKTENSTDQELVRQVLEVFTLPLFRACKRRQRLLDEWNMDCEDTGAAASRKAIIVYRLLRQLRLIHASANAGEKRMIDFYRCDEPVLELDAATCEYFPSLPSKVKRLIRPSRQNHLTKESGLEHYLRSSSNRWNIFSKILWCSETLIMAPLILLLATICIFLLLIMCCLLFSLFL